MRYGEAQSWVRSGQLGRFGLAWPSLAQIGSVWRWRGQAWLKLIKIVSFASRFVQIDAQPIKFHWIIDDSGLRI